MAVFNAEGAYRSARTGAGARVLLPAAEAPAAPCWTLSAYAGDPLPATIHDPRLERLDSPGRWRLACREGSFEFTARAVEVQEALPGLFDEMLAPYALRSRDKRVVRWLLRLVRLPGGAKLLRTWQARRGR
jgi:hypothetical protein